MKIFSHKLIFLIVFISLQLCIPTISPAQINLKWNSYVQEPDYTWDYSSEVDNSGNVYLAYQSIDTPSDTVYLKKYDSDGNFLWKKIIRTDASYDVDFSIMNLYIDSLNNPIINLLVDSFASSTYYYLNYYIKCDTAGVPIWQFTVDQSYSASTTIDVNSNLYIEHFRSIDSTMVLSRYDSNGALIYEASTFFYSGIWGANPVVDGSGSAWFGYNLSAGAPTNIVTSKWYKANATGTIIDSLILNGGGNPVLYDQQGNLFVLHRQQFFTGNTLDSLKSSVLKYDPSMNLVWNSGITEMNQIDDIKPDGNGNIYAYGYYGAITQVNDVKIGKYDSLGNFLWIHKFGLNINGLSNYYYGHLALDGSGNPYLKGDYFPNGFIPTLQTNEFFIKRLDSTGAVMDMEIFYYPGYSGSLLRDFGNDFYILRPQFETYDLYKFCFCESTVSGYVFFDADSSCAQNGTEQYLNNTIVQIQPANLTLHTDSNGYYHAFLSDNSYDVIFAPALNYDHSCSTDTVSIQITNGVPVNVNSGNYMDATFHDLTLNTARGWVRPGFNFPVGINYKNAGGSIQAGAVNFIHDPIFNFVQSTPPPDVINGDTLTWNFNGMLQADSKNIAVTLYTPSNNTFGTPFHNQFTINGNLPELTPADNIVSDSGIVMGSFDPNDKSVTPRGTGSQGFITANDSLLQYTIHFENIGNDTAFTVAIMDTIDNDLDIASLQMGAGSHPFMWSIMQSNVLYIRFENIQLPDSSHHDNNNGFINYFIRQKPNLANGTKITNTAHIYFDFNSAVPTNTTLNTIVNTTSIYSEATEKEIIVYPNPVNDWITIADGKTRFTNVTLYDLSGKKIAVNTVPGERNDLRINCKIVKQGIYILGLRNDKELFYKKIIKID